MLDLGLRPNTFYIKSMFSFFLGVTRPLPMAPPDGAPLDYREEEPTTIGLMGPQGT